MTNASSSKVSVEDMIRHYQHSIEKSQHDPKRILHCIGKLNRMHVTMQHLQSTGIGKTVNVLRKDDGEIGMAAKALISKWKQMVAEHESEGEEEKIQDGYHCDDDDSSKLTTESISNSDRKSHKTHEHQSGRSSSSSNHHHHHHQHQTHEHGKHGDTQIGHSHKRKYSSDDTQEHLTHSKHKHKSHSRDDVNSGSRHRDHGQENNDCRASDHRHKSSSKHSKDEHHHRSRHEVQSNGDEIPEKRHRHESKHDSKHSNHHKTHSHTSDKVHSSTKKQKSDSSSASSSKGEKSTKIKHRKSDDGIEIDHSMGTSFADALGMLQPKSGQLLTVPSLHELCIRFLQKNIDALEYTGGVPFEILKPVLERASSEQLNAFETYNPYLIDDSDVLWQQHCQRKFKACKRQEMETWRDMYYRCVQEQEARLNSLTNNIKKSQSVAMPVRQTKMAFVESFVKPPRSVIKKQHQYGTHTKLTATPAARFEALSAVTPNAARVGDARLRTLASMRDTAQAQPSSNGTIKPKKAPLMAKSIQLLKGYKR